MSASSYNMTRHSLQSVLAKVLWTYYIAGYQENNNVINFAFHWHCLEEYEMKTNQNLLYFNFGLLWFVLMSWEGFGEKQ
jgi:hypothetical protein